MDFQQALRGRIRHFTFHVYKKTGHEDRPEQPLRYGWSDPRTTANGRQPHERRAQDLSTISPPHQLLMRSDAGTNHSWNNNHNNNNIWEYSWRRRTEGYVAFLSFFFSNSFASLPCQVHFSSLSIGFQRDGLPARSLGLISVSWRAEFETVLLCIFGPSRPYDTRGRRYDRYES